MLRDGYLKTSSVGAIVVSDSEPGVVWAGMGESTIRGDVSHGDGVYKSTVRRRRDQRAPSLSRARAIAARTCPGAVPPR